MESNAVVDECSVDHLANSDQLSKIKVREDCQNIESVAKDIKTKLSLKNNSEQTSTDTRQTNGIHQMNGTCDSPTLTATTQFESKNTDTSHANQEGKYHFFVETFMPPN